MVSPVTAGVHADGNGTTANFNLQNFWFTKDMTVTVIDLTDGKLTRSVAIWSLGNLKRRCAAQ